MLQSFLYCCSHLSICPSLPYFTNSIQSSRLSSKQHILWESLTVLSSVCLMLFKDFPQHNYIRALLCPCSYLTHPPQSYLRKGPYLTHLFIVGTMPCDSKLLDVQNMLVESMNQLSSKEICKHYVLLLN